MKLKKTYFNQIKINQNCIFRNIYSEYIYGIKYGKDKIYHNDILKYTGREHSCYLISDFNFIDKLFASFQWYLKKKWKKANGRQKFRN